MRRLAKHPTGRRRSFLNNVTLLAIASALVFCTTIQTLSAEDEVSQEANDVQTIQEDYHDTSDSLNEIGIEFSTLQPSSRFFGLPWRRVHRVPTRTRARPTAFFKANRVLPVAAVNTTNLLTFPGISNRDGYYPPDPTASVGATQIVETVNVSFQVFSKTGTSVFGPAEISSVWSSPPFGGVCQNGPYFSDPVVLYDKIAGRWLITQMASADGFTTSSECIAVSTTSDATGSYYRYAYSFSNLHDYPKFGVWPDAYYGTYNVFTGSGFTTSVACAYNRTAMLSGGAANAICKALPVTIKYSPFSPLPADLDGVALPPSGEPNFLLAVNLNTALIQPLLYKYHVDFQVPSNSTITGPTALTSVGEACYNNGSYSCIFEPGGFLDSLGDRPMFRLAYRNFGTYESLVACSSASSPNGVGKFIMVSPHWWEIRSPNALPTVFQEGTFSPDTSTDRWMCSIAMDKTGNIAIGYSASSSTIFPNIAVTGRLKSDPKGSMRAETGVVTGTRGSQTGTSRWGDYTSMAIDPVDDLTFVYTNEYYPVTSGFGWTTQITSFRLGP